MRPASARKPQISDGGGDRSSEEEDLAFSAQVFAEFLYQATRPGLKDGMTPAEAIDFLHPLRVFPVQPVTLEVFDSGIYLSRRYQLSYWDGAILAAAQILGCDVLYTEDLNHGQAYGRVLNPFAEADGLVP